MLFNSHAFLFGYLPVVLAGFFALGRVRHSWAALWLGLASIFFYGWWSPTYVALLLASIAANYAFGHAIARTLARSGAPAAKRVLAAAVAADLALLAYYKYAGFFVRSLDALAGLRLEIGEVILPLGISFFTFTQIAYLVDTYRGQVRERNPIHYLLFVTWFPHLIAGPILHHAEMIPQFRDPEIYRPRAENVAVGVGIFAIGLAKKVILADGIQRYVGPVFDSPAGAAIPFLDAWGGALAYALQLYFDFSGYSDMAIGLSRLFGIRLPLNFDSPYKSTSIIDFWRRWHMTLSRFLRDYLYIPLGGNRRGEARRYANLLVTMLLGGLWHGASWTFVAWGGLHGALLAVNHGWRAWRARRGAPPTPAWIGAPLTFVAVVVAFVVFRAPDFEVVGRVFQGLFGLSGSLASTGRYAPDGHQAFLTGSLLAIAWLLPNAQQIFCGHRPAFDASPAVTTRWVWQPTWRWAVGFGILLAAGILGITQNSEFLYFQF